jgi:aldehyde:ferredoxin oxidoreductase
MGHNLAELKAKQKLLKTWSYVWHPIDRGYNNRTLYINVGDCEIKEKPVSQQMKDKFVGGKGFGLRLLWDATKPETKWSDPENEIVISTGPLCGITQYSGTGKSLLVSISPQTDSIMDSNVGGYFGPFMKFAGFDSLELQGKADKDVIIFIDGVNHTIEIFEDPGFAVDSHLLGEELTEYFAIDEKDAKNIGIVSAGAAAEHSLIGMLNFTFWDSKRKKIRLKQAGRGGIGTVFRDKKIKAIVARIPGVQGNLNNVANMDKITTVGRDYAGEMRDLDDKQNQMKKKGTANIVNVMSDYDLLPTHNFKFGSHKDALKIHSDILRDKYFTLGLNDGCWIGCAMQCAKGVDDFELKTGPYQGTKVIVDGPEYETAAGLGANIGIFDYDAIIEANFYCDTYGICTITWGTIVAFIMECYENGVINKEITGGLDLHFGNIPDSLELLHQLARNEGFGKVAGTGVRKMKELFASKYGADPKFLQDIGMENKGLEYSQYVSKESLAQQGGYAMTNKGPQHDEAWLIFMDMVNNMIPTFDNKAEALHWFPMFRTWFGLQGLCKIIWNDVTPADNKLEFEPHKIPKHVRNYLSVYEGVTGTPIDEAALIRQSERVYNFQRIFNIRRGFGLRKHDAQPYRAAGPVTAEEYESRAERYDGQMKSILNVDPEGKTTEEKMAITRTYRESQYEKLLDAVYERRGWTNNGVPKIEHLKEIGMDLPELLEVITPLQ